MSRSFKSIDSDGSNNNTSGSFFKANVIDLRTGRHHVDHLTHSSCDSSTVKPIVTAPRDPIIDDYNDEPLSPTLPLLTVHDLAADEILDPDQMVTVGSEIMLAQNTQEEEAVVTKQQPRPTISLSQHHRQQPREILEVEDSQLTIAAAPDASLDYPAAQPTISTRDCVAGVAATPCTVPSPPDQQQSTMAPLSSPSSSSSSIFPLAFIPPHHYLPPTAGNLGSDYEVFNDISDNEEEEHQRYSPMPVVTIDALLPPCYYEDVPSSPTLSYLYVSPKSIQVWFDANYFAGRGADPEMNRLQFTRYAQGNQAFTETMQVSLPPSFDDLALAVMKLLSEVCSIQVLDPKSHRCHYLSISTHESEPLDESTVTGAGGEGEEELVDLSPNGNSNNNTNYKVEIKISSKRNNGSPFHNTLTCYDIPKAKLFEYITVAL